ncbi:YlxR family protein [Nesterenkonia flava]|uniref:YlxR family protein n=1 Tax=Nesterenkonia flava TaxID=469799 RepID=A0ABU1FSB8_9MICC|nr:YlxR family protein [Nesterenkonia flava]MDR5711127.1 YlxR family protein [Nesterenkonia flava]
MVPVRTCIGCRRRADQGYVVRVALEGDEVRLDAARRMPGRGAWLHPQRECFEAAVKRKAFNRAFRRPVRTTSLSFEELAVHCSPDESGLERDEHPMSADG